jgi:Phage tail tube protein
MPGKSGLWGQFGMAEEVYTNEVQQFNITGAPTGGTFTLTYDGATTATIAWNAAAAAVQTALNALPNLGNGVGTTLGVTCGGGALPGSAVTVTFSGLLVAGRNVPQLTANIAALTGGAPVFNPSTTTPGTGYGDPQTVTRFLEFENESFVLNRDVIESTAIRTGNRLLRTDRFAVNRKDAGGDINFEVAYNGFGLLFKHMFGTSAITTPTNGVLTRDHTYQIADPVGKSTTMQIGRPDMGTSTVDPFTYKGCKIQSWELSQALDGFLMLKTTVDAQDEDTTISLAAASYPATQALGNFLQGQATVQGANFDITAISIAYDAALNTTRYFIRQNSLKKEPPANGFIAFTGTITAEFNDMVAYSRFTSGTPAAVTMTWTGTQIENVASPGPYSYQIILTLPQVRFDGITPNVTNMDVLSQAMPIKVLWDGTTSPSLVYRTTDTTD